MSANDVSEMLGDRRTLVSAPYVPYEGVTEEAILGVKKCYSVMLRLDGKGVLFPNAKSWSQAHNWREADPHMWFFQLLALCTEIPDMGGRIISVDKRNKDQNRTYWRVVQAMGRSMTGKANRSDYELISTYTLGGHRVDFSFLHDCMECKAHIETGGKSASASAPTPKRARHIIPTDVDFDALNLGCFETRDGEPDAADLLAIDWSQANFQRRGTREADDEEVGEDLFPEPEPEDEEGDDSEPGFEDNRPEAAIEAEAAGPNKRKKEQKDKNKRPGSDFFGNKDKPFTGGVSKGPKVVLNVTPIPAHDGTVVALMCRFLVFDPYWSAAEGFKEILANVHKRNNAAPRSQRRDLFQNYERFFRTSTHPVSSYTDMKSYIRAAIGVSAEVAAAPRDGIFRSASYNMTNNPCYIDSVLSVRNCYAVLDSMDVDIRIPIEEWWNPATGRAGMPFTSYTYLPEQLFWFHPEYVGLSEQYFPHIDSSEDYLAALMAGRDLSSFLAKEGEQIAEVGAELSEIQKLLRENPIVRRRDVNENKLLNYDTNNEFVHRAAEAKIINDNVMKYYPAHYTDTFADVQDLIKRHQKAWRAHIADPDLRKRITECETYNLIRNKAQLACMEIFCSLWQLEGDIDKLSIPAPIKAMLKWYRDKKLPHVTREFIIIDDELDMFGNVQLRTMLSIFAYTAKIIQPMVCLLACGLYSCYEWTPDLNFNMTLHGKFEVGKTFAAIKTLVDFTTIPGTVLEYTGTTDASDTTKKMHYDEIIAADEVEPWKVSEEEGKKNMARVNKEKVKMTRKQIGHVSFEYVQIDGRRIRWDEQTVTDHYTSTVQVTNMTLDPKGPLSSRFFRMTVKQPRLPANELNYTVEQAIKSDARVYTQLGQFFSAAACKAAMVGGILPRPFMGIFEDISNKVKAYLEEKKAISTEKGARGMEIMRPLAVQEIYKMAAHYTFDMPFSPHYKVPFKAHMIRDMQPYLYCTTDIIWWVWTACASEWVENDNARVLKAARDFATKQAVGETAYELYERDKDNSIPWREHHNPNPHAGDVAGDDMLVDLQYLRLEGTLDSIAEDISQCMDAPRLCKNDVIGCLRALNEQHIQSDGYIPQPKTTFARFHKFTRVPNGEDPGEKFTGDERCPYLISNDDPTLPRTIADVPRKETTVGSRVVDFRDLNRKGCIYIMPFADRNYKEDIIEEALMAAMLCSTMRPGKVLLGQAPDYDTTMLRVRHFSKEWINHNVDLKDRERGFTMKRGKPVYGGNDPIPPFSLREGLTFKRRGAMRPTQAALFGAVALAPHSDDKWKVAYQRAVENNQSPIEVIYDLNAYSARRQHMLAGLPFDEPVRTPDWIRAAYIESCESRGIPHTLGCDYPFDDVDFDAQVEGIYKHAGASALHKDEVFKTNNGSRKRCEMRDIMPHDDTTMDAPTNRAHKSLKDKVMKKAKSRA